VHINNVIAGNVFTILFKPACHLQTMKIFLLLFGFLFFSLIAYSQSRNNLSIVYGMNANLVDIHGVIGDFGYFAEDGKSIGISYTRAFTRVFSMETGLFYSTNNIRLSTIQGPRGDFYYDGVVKMVSVPLYARVTFLKFLFAQGGFLLDHQTNYAQYGVVNDQSGLGLEMGVGGNVKFGPMSIFINPYFCRHALNGRNNLIEAGAKTGIGYNF